jgi:hypothetical protein
MEVRFRLLEITTRKNTKATTKTKARSTGLLVAQLSVSVEIAGTQFPYKLDIGGTA